VVDVRSLLLDGLTSCQKDAVGSGDRRLLIVAGAGSGKTEVMARRVAWWVAVDGVPKDSIVAFTFTDRAAEEMKFRIRHRIEAITPRGEDTTLGGMYVGTIHGFCLKLLRELRPDDYHNFDVVDEAGRVALVQGRYHGLLGLARLQNALDLGQYATIDTFLQAYDLLNEYNALDVELASPTAPYDVGQEVEWCKEANLRTQTGKQEPAQAFAVAAGRYYAYLRCRRFLDFSTSQSELVRLLHHDNEALDEVRARFNHIVVDEVQDLNVVQDDLVRTIAGEAGLLTAVGDHRQAIFAWRGSRVDIMAALYEELDAATDGDVIELPENFRSTPRIIDLANRWARTVSPVRSMSSPDMEHGRKRRKDLHSTHVAALAFPTRGEEAEWIANKIKALVPSEQQGAYHDTKDGARGLLLSDIAILIRSSTDARTYMQALERHGISAVFRAGPDLFSQPEVLLFVAALARTAGLERFYGGQFDPKSLPNRIQSVLGCPPDPESVIGAASAELRRAGLPLDSGTEGRLLLAAELIHNRISGHPPPPAADLRGLRTPRLVEWLQRKEAIRRVFPQTLFHLLLAETGVHQWDSMSGHRARAAMFHLGQLSTLVTGIETPGWTSAQEFKYQVIALSQWGTQKARTEEAPLLVPPDAVTIITIHSAKGLEFPAVFLADVCARRFPSGYARQQPELPFDGPILKRIDPARLADNSNYDDERRLMYVALSRAERYLFVTASGRNRSQFFRTIEDLVQAVGGSGAGSPEAVPTALRHVKSEANREFRLVTSFSDLRYYVECPHDFYLRKVLGFAPTIDQAFGYGRGVHNVLRAVHSDPVTWAELAKDPGALSAALEQLVARGLLYLRYTTGDPAENMRAKAKLIVADYVQAYAHELARLQFEAEREFETLIEEEQVLISGAMDLVRLDDPPRVSIIDFKSGEPESDARLTLDEEEMRLQVSLYGLAARKELEYDPERGIVRYLGESDPGKRELSVELDEVALTRTRAVVAGIARDIRERKFHLGPRRSPAEPGGSVRCERCDFGEFCGMNSTR
jgi:DNA helicase-2/ATP-dependent DNA helicase PcrA